MDVLPAARTSAPFGVQSASTSNVARIGAGDGSGGGVYAATALVHFLGELERARFAHPEPCRTRRRPLLTGAASEAECRDAEIVENAGLFGGGVAADNGAQLTIHATITNCANPAGCSRILDNYTATAVGETSPGGGVWVTGGADASIRRTTFRGNSAPGSGAALAVEGAGSTALFEGNVVHAQPSRPFYVFAGGNLTAAFVTAWGNTVGSSGTFSATGAGSNIAVYSSVTLDSKTFGGLGPGAAYSGDCIVTRSLTDFPPPPDPGSFELVASEGVVLLSPATGNPRLRSDSPAIDYCDTFRYTPIDSDLDGEVRGFDVVTIPSLPFGPYDLGADEWRPLFLGDFEPGTCAQWSANTGGC